MNRGVILLLAVVVVLAAVPAPVSAQETRSGGTIVVGENETIDGDLTAFGGTVIVRGTVTGDLTAIAGNVVVDGQVDGNLEAVAGNVRINGTVAGDANAAGGNVFLAQDGRIDGEFSAGAGTIVVEGEVGDDATLGADTITIGSSAVIGGDLTYDGQLNQADGASIAGAIRQESNVGPTMGLTGQEFPNWVSWVYSFLANLVLGAIALLAFPRFSTGVAGLAGDDPVRSGGIGLLLFVGVPILLVILFISLVGIPLGIVGILVYMLLLWLGYVYGSYAVGTWLLDRADTENRWLALVTGLLVVSVVGLVPILGGLIQFLVLLLGVGALALGGRNRYRGRRARRAPDSETRTAA